MMITRVLAILVALGSPAAVVLAQESAPPTLSEDPDGGNFLFIPGVGKIPLSPGARGLAPPLPGEPQEGGLPRGVGPRALQPKPEPQLSPQEREARDLDRLFDRLANAEDERESKGAEGAILRHWSQSGSDTIDLLAARALAAEAAGAPTLARALLDYVVSLSPRWPEGFVRRARVAASQGDVPGALADLETAARLEPRRFDALQAMGALAEKAGDKKRALDAYRKALDMAPKDAALQRREEQLRLEVEGRGI